MVFKDNVLGVHCWLSFNPLMCGSVDVQCCRIMWKSYGFRRVCDCGVSGFCRHL